MASRAQVVRFRCVLCEDVMERRDLDSHLSSDHLDYFPFSCGYCGHFLPTESLAHFHARRKRHIPMKIREHPNMEKDQELQDLIKRCLDAGNTSLPVSKGAKITPTVPTPLPTPAPTTPKLNNAMPSNSRPPSLMERTNSRDSNSSSEKITFGRRDFRPVAVHGSNKRKAQEDPSYRGVRIRPEEGGELSKRKSPRVPRVIERKGSVEEEEKDEEEEEMEDLDMSPQEVDEPSGEVEMGRELKCAICQSLVHAKVKAHVKAHMKSRPLAGCFYCDFRGKNSHAVRIHITWKHPDCPNKEGIRDLSGQGATYQEMYQMCFGEPVTKATSEEAELVAKHLGILRPYAKRAAKTLGGSTTISVTPTTAPTTPTLALISKSTKCTNSTPRLTMGDMQESSVASLLAASPHLPPSATTAIIKVVTNPTGRTYRHITCLQCGADILDALISQHVFQNHIARRDLVQCGYCEFSVAYAVSDVRRHLHTKHKSEQEKLIDNRQRPEVQEEYRAWRYKCFPEIKPSSSGCKAFSQSTRDTRLSMVVAPSLASATPTTHVNKINTSTSSSTPRVRPRPPDSLYSQRICAKCGEKVTYLWEARHIWRHAQEIGEARFLCGVDKCGYSTYLLRTLDSHCNSHRPGWPAAKFGYTDREKELRPLFDTLWKECYLEDPKDREPLAPEVGGLSINGHNDFASNRIESSWVEEEMLEQEEVEEQVSLHRFSFSTDHAVCQQCHCALPVASTEEHVWYVHLEGVLPYHCGRCEASFSRQDQMRTHWSVEHGEEGRSAQISQKPQVKCRFNATFPLCFPDSTLDTSIQLD